MDCKFEKHGEGENGKTLYVCAYCKQARESTQPPERIHRQCPARAGDSHPPPDTSALVATLQEDERKYAGDWIAEFTAAFGIPACGGCEVRKQWFNNWHKWLVGKRG